MAGDKVCNALFLCTHNSARSIMAEGLLDYVGKGRYKGCSAGSMPATAPHPFALRTLANLQLPTAGFYSKNRDEFARPGAPEMHFVFTACDNAANEVCPVWPGQPVTAHWGVPDPSRFEGADEERLREFARVAKLLKHRIELFGSLPVAKLDRLTLHGRVREIGRQ
jgi:arsenate reductase